MAAEEISTDRYPRRKEDNQDDDDHPTLAAPPWNGMRSA